MLSLFLSLVFSVWHRVCYFNFLIRFPHNALGHGTPLKQYCISKVRQLNTRQEYPELPESMQMFLEALTNL